MYCICKTVHLVPFIQIFTHIFPSNHKILCLTYLCLVIALRPNLPCSNFLESLICCRTSSAIVPAPSKLETLLCNRAVPFLLVSRHSLICSNAYHDLRELFRIQIAPTFSDVNFSARSMRSSTFRVAPS